MCPVGRDVKVPRPVSVSRRLEADFDGLGLGLGLEGSGLVNIPANGTLNHTHSLTHLSLKG